LGAPSVPASVPTRRSSDLLGKARARRHAPLNKLRPTSTPRRSRYVGFGEEHPDGRALPQGALRFDTPAVRLDQVLHDREAEPRPDRKSTRLNSSHDQTSYA